MIELTLGTVLAIVDSHTRKLIVIYFVGASCTVFARITVTIIVISQIQINFECCEFFSPF